MRIVADENIPLLKEYFGASQKLIMKSGRAITQHDLVKADVLLVRSVTEVNQALLQNTSVKFVGSVTSGEDHLDIAWLNAQEISYSIAKGCNSDAVSEYVVCAIAGLQKNGLLQKPNLRAAVIGMGNIGKRVAEKLKLLGFDVIAYDPFYLPTTWEEVQDVDLITLHTPLTSSGKFPTYHLVEKNFLQKQKAGCVLMNTGRGSVIHFADLKKFGRHLHWCFDVWENEPHIDPEVLQQSVLATPHIAGYSVQSKLRGVEMVYQDALQRNIIPNTHTAKISYPKKILSLTNSNITWQEIALQIYNPLDTTQLLKSGQAFDALRRHFPLRYEFAYVTLDGVNLTERDKSLLGVSP